MKPPKKVYKKMSPTTSKIPTIKDIDPEERMRTYICFMSKNSWVAVREELNEKKMNTNLAQLINDMREDFRIEALRQLDQTGIDIDRDWEQLQREKISNDPDDVFPMVATSWLLQTLPVSMTDCNVCGEGYTRGEDIIKKSCGKHTMHRFCLLARLQDGDIPLFGPCECNDGGYCSGLWRLILTEPAKGSTSVIRRRPATPMPAPLNSNTEPSSAESSDTACENNSSSESESECSWSSGTSSTVASPASEL